MIHIRLACDGYGLLARSTLRPQSTRHDTGNFQQVGLHGDDPVLAVPVAGEEVLQAVRLETDGLSMNQF